ncbi:MAG: hypothetical protein WCW03_00770 [Candidatus Paceibacterota bacterium]|jgi:hypothetical protein
MQISPNKWTVIASILTAVIVVSTALNIPGTKSPSLIYDNLGNSGNTVFTFLDPNISSVEVGQVETIRWISEGYIPRTVSINLIRKVSSMPEQYELIRTIATSTMNDGVAIWVPGKSDVGDNLYIEIGCELSQNSCNAGGSISPIAVNDTGRFANTAASYQAIEQLNNR